MLLSSDGLEVREELRVLIGGLTAGLGGGPEVGGEEGVGLLQGVEGGHDEVGAGAGLAGGAGVHVRDASELENLGGDGGSDDTGTTGSGHQAHGDGTGLAGHLHGHGVGHTDLVTPVATADRDDVELGSDEGSADGEGDFLAGAGANTNVAVLVTNQDVGLEAGALTGAGLLLHGEDGHDLIGEGLVGHEGVDDLALLDGHGEQEDLLEGLELVLLHEASELGAGDPLLLVGVTATAATTASTATAEATSTGSISLGSCVGHAGQNSVTK